MPLGEPDAADPVQAKASGALYVIETAQGALLGGPGYEARLRQPDIAPQKRITGHPAHPD